MPRARVVSGGIILVSGVLLLVTAPGIVGALVVVLGVILVLSPGTRSGTSRRGRQGHHRLRPAASVARASTAFLAGGCASFAALCLTGSVGRAPGALPLVGAVALSATAGCLVAAGHLAGEWAAVIVVAGAGVVLLWEAASWVLGDAVWDSASYGSPIFLVIVLPVLAAPVAVGVLSRRTGDLVGSALRATRGTRAEP